MKGCKQNGGGDYRYGISKGRVSTGNMQPRNTVMASAAATLPRIDIAVQNLLGRSHPNGATHQSIQR